MAFKKLNHTTMKGLMSIIRFTNKQFHSLKRGHQDAKLRSKKTISISNKNIATGLKEQIEIPQNENVPEQLTEKKTEKVLDNGLTDWFTPQQMENSKRETGAGDGNTDVQLQTQEISQVPISHRNDLLPILEESVPPLKTSKNLKMRRQPEPSFKEQHFMGITRPTNQSYPWPSYSDRMKRKDQPNPLKSLRREFSTSSNRKKIDAQVKSVMEEWINNSPNNIFRIDQLHNISCLVPKSINSSQENIDKSEDKLDVTKRNKSSKPQSDPNNEMMNEWYRHTYKRYLNLNKIAKQTQEEKEAKSKKNRKDNKELITTYENQKYFNLKSKKENKPLPRLVKKYDTNAVENNHQDQEIPEEIVVRMDDDKDLYKKKVLPSLKIEKCPVVKTNDLKIVPMRRIKRTHYSGRIQVMDSTEIDDEPERADDHLQEVQRKKLPMIP